MQKITPHLWFDTQAKEAAEYYVSVFGDNSKVASVQKIQDTPSGDAYVVSFTLRGQDFMAISAGPMFKFTEAVSFMVNCDTQEEIDYFWSKLSADPKSEQCGWCKDKFGLSWQVVPTALSKLLANPDKAKAGRAMQAMLGMKKIVIADLEKA